MICKDCNKKFLESLKISKRCEPCNKIFHEKKLELKAQRESLLLEKKKKKEKNCLHCKKFFIANAVSQSYCYNPCNPKLIALENCNKTWMKGRKYPNQKTKVHLV